MLRLVVLVALALPGGYHARVTPIPSTMHLVSWHRGCPVPLRDLRLIKLSYWGFDGKEHEGELVAHRDAADDLVRVFRRLYAVRYPIRRMRRIDFYGASDDRSLVADNTSAFNCRPVAGTTRWSEHAYGRAIDINPVENPYVIGNHVSPESGRRYADRSKRLPGMIHDGDAVVRAFAAVGWGWGGHWRSPTDYQHFSASGK
jgi:poly-gamma-glutamate synthesis protein (capsule biosynthesis protein)